MIKNAQTEATLALTVSRLERRRNSVNGNPRYKIHFEGGIVLSTAKDTGFAYEITSGWEGRTFYVQTNSRGEIVNMTALKLR